METVSHPLRIFVYGSLKRGYRNHVAYCAGYASLRKATVEGQLYRQADGYPMLVVPPAAILAEGTSNVARDLARLAELEAVFKHPPGADAAPPQAEAVPTPWQEIRGEILTWPADWTEIETIVARLDQLEDFYPTAEGAESKPSLYHRVIVLARHAEGVEPVWTYIAPGGTLPAGVTPMGQSWP